MGFRVASSVLILVAFVSTPEPGLAQVNRSANDRVSNTATTDSLYALDSAWARSYATHDTVLALQVMSDRFMMTSADGRTKDRATELADIRPSPGLTMHYFRTSDVRLEIYSGAAVVTGVAAWAFTYNGQETSIRRRYTAAYARGGPLGWQLVALHMGRVS